MKILCYVLSAGLVTSGLVRSASADFIDTFATAGDASNYTAYRNFTNGGNPNWSLTTGSGSALLNTDGNNTIYYLRNTGETLGPGATVSAELTGPLGYEGLGFATSLSGPDLGAGFFESIAGNFGTAGHPVQVDLPSGLLSLDGFSPSNTTPGDMSFTRGTGPNANVYSYSFSGGGLPNPITGSMTVGSASQIVYFGIAGYGSQAENFASLTFTAPEPAAIGLITLGSLSLLKRKR